MNLDIDFSKILIILYRHKSIETDGPVINKIEYINNEVIQDVEYLEFFDYESLIKKCKDLDWTILESSEQIAFLNNELFHTTNYLFEWRLISKNPRKLNIFEDLQYELTFFKKTQYEFELNYFLGDKNFKFHNSSITKFRESYFQVLNSLERMNEMYNICLKNMTDEQHLEYEIFKGI